MRGQWPRVESRNSSQAGTKPLEEREHGADVCGACGPVRADCVLATNIEIGNHMPTILPARSLAAPAIKTAMQTHQLHMIALTTVGINAPEHFFMTVATARS